ncbi:MAG TPA: hypothetical protein PKE27_08860 [Povalibacter sp.]|uniref:hypothetical protein n=1 Tax=Povalibacter sp. TaxID=1962978 RepID=UPI002C484833|nr:hypothetical protein [Povalibacter sp.]HMN44669.1 hypothetical protein [Povalibacter sp.]
MATVAGWDDPITREVAVAVELLDPVSQQRVSQDVKVTLGGRVDQPYISASRRFVWLGNFAAWPPSISVDPGKLPFAPIANQPLAAAPAGWPSVSPEKRRIRVTLTPSANYPFDEGVTALSGYLFEKSAQDPNVRVPIANAEVWFQWAVGASWLPATPPRVRTDARGEFGLFARIAHSAGQEPDVLRGLLKVKLFVKRGSTTRETPANFRYIDPPLLSITPPYPPVSDGRIVNGAALVHGVALDWATLV